MAFGATLGPCSCRCGATLYRVDPLSGELLWNVSRRVSEHQLILSGPEILTLGADPPGKSDGRLMSRTDDDTGAPVNWYADRGALAGITYSSDTRHPVSNREAIALSADGSVVWALGDTLASWDTNTGQQRARYGVPGGPRFGTSETDFGSTIAVIGSSLYCTTGGRPERFDENCVRTAVANIGPGKSRDMCIAGGAIVALHGAVPLGIPYFQVFDTGLTRQGFFPANSLIAQSGGRTSLMQALRVVPFGSGAIVLTQTPFAPFRNWLCGMSVSPIAENWIKEITTSTSADHQPAVLIDGSNLYLDEEGVLFCRSASDGSEQWSVDPGLGRIHDIAAGSDFVVVCGSGASPFGTLVAIEKATGAVRWRTLHGTIDVSVAVSGEDRVYAIGPVGPVSMVS